MRADRAPFNGGSPSGGLARASFEHALDAMLVADDERRYVDANPAACSLLGLSYEELVSRRLDDFVPPEARSSLDAVWREFLDSGDQSGEFELLAADGSPLTLEFRAKAHVLPGLHLSVLRDIGDRAVAEEAWRTKQAYDLLAGVLEHVDVGLHVVDEQQRIVFANPTCAAMLGYGSADELLGLPAHETIHHKRPDGSRLPVDECDQMAVFETGESIRGEDWFVRQDGSMVPIAYSAAPISLPEGRGAVVAFGDISERRRVELEREREREFLGAVLESLDTGIAACGADGVLSLFNRATREMHGMVEEPLPPEDWAGCYDLFMADGQTPMSTEDVPLFRALQGELVRDAEMVIAPMDREPRNVLCNGQRITSKDGRALGAVVAMHDVTERRRAEKQLAHQALHDPLTGLPNRALLLDRLGHALAIARRNGSAVAVLLVDLDRLGLINDSLGHHVGDELIVAVTRRLDEAMRAADTVGRPIPGTLARFGGDEFVVVCEGLATSERGATRIAQRITDALHAPFVVGGREVFASASVGIALSAENAGPDSLLRDAAAAMRRAKERGGAGYELFDETMRARVIDRLQSERALQRAIEQDELRLHYQPIVALADHSVVAAEALVRWEHPERGLLAPSEFIQLAEESGLIVPLGAWVLRESCRQIARWKQSFGAELAPRISVNVSARQLADPQIVEEVEQALSEAGADTGHLALEITETVLMADGRTPVATLETLKRLGSRLMLDDFGTGYSSLSYLSRLPLDTLKLDRSFIAPLGPSGEGRAIATAIVDLAHALDMTIVAEGVETEDQLRVLETLGCDLAQGYLFSRPLPATEMTDLLATQAAGATAGSSS
jgi:diguanylate cyclase (GGDEF)-like protein/PAS domain S-box-containing protein